MLKLVNLLESLPFLQVIEWLLIGIPLLIHGIWGIKRALQPKMNSFGSGGKSPHLNYGRNHAFTWQRLTSWILLIGIIGHVVQMRFIGYPTNLYRSTLPAIPRIEKRIVYGRSLPVKAEIIDPLPAASQSREVLFFNSLPIENTVSSNIISCNIPGKRRFIR